MDTQQPAGRAGVQQRCGMWHPPTHPPGRLGRERRQCAMLPPAHPACCCRTRHPARPPAAASWPPLSAPPWQRRRPWPPPWPLWPQWQAAQQHHHQATITRKRGAGQGGVGEGRQGGGGGGTAPARRRRLVRGQPTGRRSLCPLGAESCHPPAFAAGNDNGLTALQPACGRRPAHPLLPLLLPYLRNLLRLRLQRLAHPLGLRKAGLRRAQRLHKRVAGAQLRHEASGVHARKS